MAKSNLAPVEDASSELAPFGYKDDGTPRKRAFSGPRKVRPLNVLFQVTDSDGNPVPNAKLQVLYIGRDTDALLSKIDANPGAQRTKVDVQAKDIAAE